MRLMPLLAIALLVAALLVVAFSIPTIHTATVLGEPRPSFYARLTPNKDGDTSFVLERLTDTMAVLAWADESGLHRAQLSRQDFDRMFGPVRVEPLTPEEQTRP